MDVIDEYKQKGIVKIPRDFLPLPAGPEAGASSQEFIDVDVARINPIGARMDADPATVVEELCKIKAAGKGVIGMKILGEGVMRDRVGEALQHALALDCIDCFTIGAENRVRTLADLIQQDPGSFDPWLERLTGGRSDMSTGYSDWPFRCRLWPSRSLRLLREPSDDRREPRAGRPRLLAAEVADSGRA